MQDSEEPWAVVCRSFIAHRWVSGSAPGRAQLCGVYKVHSPRSWVGSSSMDLVILTWTVHPNTPAQVERAGGSRVTVAGTRRWLNLEVGGLRGDSSD